VRELLKYLLPDFFDRTGAVVLLGQFQVEFQQARLAEYLATLPAHTEQEKLLLRDSAAKSTHSTHRLLPKPFFSEHTYFWWLVIPADVIWGSKYEKEKRKRGKMKKKKEEGGKKRENGNYKGKKLQQGKINPF
jgi:hypothetical protein